MLQCGSALRSQCWVANGSNRRPVAHVDTSLFFHLFWSAALKAAADDAAARHAAAGDAAAGDAASREAAARHAAAGDAAAGDVAAGNAAARHAAAGDAAAGNVAAALDAATGDATARNTTARDAAAGDAAAGDAGAGDTGAGEAGAAGEAGCAAAGDAAAGTVAAGDAAAGTVAAVAAAAVVDAVVVADAAGLILVRKCEYYARQRQRHHPAQEGKREVHTVLNDYPDHFLQAGCLENGKHRARLYAQGFYAHYLRYREERLRGGNAFKYFPVRLIRATTVRNFPLHVENITRSGCT